MLSAHLERVGISRRHAAALRQEGWLRPILPGTLLVGRAGPTEWQLAVAASLLGGPGSSLSHLTAGQYHGFEVARASIPELTVVKPRQVRVRGVRVHSAARLDGCDVERGRDGVSVTTAARTIVDLAPLLSPLHLAKVLDEAIVARKVRSVTVPAVLERSGPRPGVALLHRLLADRAVTGDGAESHLERKVAEALTGLGPFEEHHVVTVGNRVYRLDLARPDLRIAVESDGWAVRSRSRTKCDGDRRRDNDLAAAGWSVVHLTSAMSAADMRAAVVAVMLKVAERRGATRH